MLQLPDERPYRNIITKNLCVFATKTGHFTIRFLNRQIYRIFSPSRAREPISFTILLNKLVLPRIFQTNARFTISRREANTAFTLFRIRMDDFLSRTEKTDYL